MKTINLTGQKLWDFLYPIYANQAVFFDEYEVLANAIETNFKLTPEQWEFVLAKWEEIQVAVAPGVQTESNDSIMTCSKEEILEIIEKHLDEWYELHKHLRQSRRFRDANIFLSELTEIEDQYNYSYGENDVSHIARHLLRVNIKSVNKAATLLMME